MEREKIVEGLCHLPKACIPVFPGAASVKMGPRSPCQLHPQKSSSYSQNYEAEWTLTCQIITIIINEYQHQLMMTVSVQALGLSQKDPRNVIQS